LRACVAIATHARQFSIASRLQEKILPTRRNNPQQTVLVVVSQCQVDDHTRYPVVDPACVLCQLPVFVRANDPALE
jgi:hypothetical protein